LASSTTTLPFLAALILGEAMYVSILYVLCAFTITTILRFISLVTNSEQSGIQSLGPDYIAIWKIRIISGVFTFTLPAVGLLCFQSIPGFFYTLYNTDSIPPGLIFEQDPYDYILLLPILIAVIANVVLTSYSAFLIHKLEHVLVSREKFVFSLECIVALLFVIVLQISSANFDRIYRLYFYYPIIMMCCCNVFPLLIIFNNKTMKKHFLILVSKPFQFSFLKHLNKINPA
jgi:hypothetical protein